MITKQWRWVLFGLMVLAQLFIAISMTTGYEEVIAQGREFRFRVAPADPNDPLRGRFMRLEFADIEVPVDTTEKWGHNVPVVVFLNEDKDGFAIPVMMVREGQNIDDQGMEFCPAKLQYINRNAELAIIEYPFNRLYINENKAPIAEEIYAEAVRDTLSQTYALVSISGGKAVLQDVYINDVSLIDLVDQRPNK